MVTPGQLNRRAAFFEQLAAMISAGVTLSKALEMAGRSRSAGIPPRIIRELSRHLQEGHTFADAMQLVSGQKLPQRGVEVSIKPNRAFWLADFDVALLAAGEESGRLDASFKLLAHYYASRAKIIRDTISGMIITLITLHVFLLVFPIGLLQGFALGIINNKYSDCLPFIIEKVLVFGSIYGVVGFFIFASQSNRGERWRSVVEVVFNMVPWLRTAVKYLAVARLAMALDSLLNAGVPVIRAWELGAVSSGSPCLKREISKWTPELEAGVTPGDMVAQIAYFPEMFTQLYQSGEVSGKLDEALGRLHTYFEEEGFRQLQTFCRVLNFTLYFTMAAMAALFIIRFWLNYFSTALNGL
jgi:type IV pilus assembly protein PilC